MYRLSAWLGLLSWLIASVTSAQATTDSEEYTAAVREALAEMDDDHFKEAHALFKHAHALQPSARTLRGLGLSSFELRDYESATRELEEALASRTKPLEGELRSEVAEMLARAYGFVGRYELAMDPSFAQLVVDGTETSVRAGQRLLLPIGRHNLEARAPAYESDRRALDVAGGENTGLSFTLSKLPIPPLVLAPEAPASSQDLVVAEAVAAPRSDQPLAKNPWLWAATGIVAVAIVATAVAVAGRDTRTREREPVLTNPQVQVLQGLVSAP